MPIRRSRSSAAKLHPGHTISTPSLDSATRTPSLRAAKSQPATAPSRRSSARRISSRTTAQIDPVKDDDPEIIDGTEALRASPDAEENDRFRRLTVDKTADTGLADSLPRELAGRRSPVQEEQATPVKSVPENLIVNEAAGDPELEAEEGATAEELQEALGRPPAVNSPYLPLPWKGRLGYACLNTYLRTSNPPVFSSRTCRLASIIEHRHPLVDPTQPEHATKNRPDREQPASLARGQKYVEAIGLANARDIVKMVRWNDRYGIKFMRLSSEMFPFASHEEYGYTLAPFASEVLAEAGRVIAELGHRVTTHPGQFTQLGSPRKSVIENAVRDLVYHDEMLSLLRLPEQMNKDAVMVLHMGGVFGDKEATLDRFRENYKKLPRGVKDRLVLENDDVSWGVHELLPICHELNIPLVLDYHHHNIIFDKDKVREGTLDIMDYYEEIAGTWARKGITQKMHYSEPTPPAITGRQRRKHAARVMTLPPCDPSMDLMIEAKDKEQAVFELMRTFKLPGFDRFSDVIPHQRSDESRAAKPPKKKPKKRKKAENGEEEEDEPPDLGTPALIVSEEDTGMGGPKGRVYWPPGMEEWLRPPKRVVKKKAENGDTPAKSTPSRARNGKKRGGAAMGGDGREGEENGESGPLPTPAKRAPPKRAVKGRAKAVVTPSTSEDEELTDMPSDLSADEFVAPVSKRARTIKDEELPPLPRRTSQRKKK